MTCLLSHYISLIHGCPSKCRIVDPPATYFNIVDPNQNILTSSNLHATPPTIVDLSDTFNNVIACSGGVFLYHWLHESEILFGDTLAS